MAAEKTGFHYFLALKGVWGRNRSVKFKTFDLVKFTEEKMDLAAVLDLAKKTIAELKVKRGGWYIGEQPCTFTDYGDGLSSTTFECFSHTKMHEEVVS